MKGKTVEKQWREATILKDRAALIDGMSFADPGFESFLPHIERLNLGGRQFGVDTSRNSTALIPADARDDRTLQRKIVLDEIESLLVLHHPSTSGADKKAKLELLRTHFEAAWTEIETVMPLERLRKGYDTLHVTLEGKPSRYHVAASRPIATDLNDEIPEHEGSAKDINTEPQLSLKEQMLADIPDLASVHDILRWGLSMSAKADQLSKEDREQVSAALQGRQQAILNEMGSQMPPIPHQRRFDGFPLGHH
jgi:hypothetical protein